MLDLVDTNMPSLDFVSELASGFPVIEMLTQLQEAVHRRRWIHMPLLADLQLICVFAS